MSQPTTEIDNGGVRCTTAPVCALCGTIGLVRHRELSDHLFGSPGIWSIRQCASGACGIGWVDPQPLPAEIGKLYTSYYTHGVAGAEAEPGDDSGQYESGGGRAKKLLAFAFPWRKVQYQTSLLHLEGLAPGTLLEVGCGSGAFLAAAAKAGWTVEGIDFDEGAIASANRRPGVRAHVADIHDPALARGYDAIVMNNVIEHLPDPRAVFARCAALLKPGGRLVMTTPNMAALGHDIFGGHWRGLEIPRHLYLYTAPALRGLAREAGFAGAQAFSTVGGNGTAFMVALSGTIARRAGQLPPAASVKAMRIRAGLAALAGRARGEWVVLVATR